MATNEQYLKRLWSLHDPARGKKQVKSSADLLNVLRQDFSSPQQIFSRAEYKDPDLRDTIIAEIAHPETGMYTVPQEVAELLRTIVGDGPVLTLYSGFGDIAFQFGKGVAVEPRPAVSDWLRLFVEMAGADIDIVTADPIRWNTEAHFQRIVCNPPFGNRFDESELFKKVLSILADKGRAGIIVPGGFLWRSDRTELRKFISENARVSAVISLPSGIFVQTSIQTGILLLEKDAPGKTYLAGSKSVADFQAIATDYTAWRVGRKHSLGFEVMLGSENWSVGYNEPIDLGVATLERRVSACGMCWLG